MIVLKDSSTCILTTMATFINLPTPLSGKINSIYHISDLHIRKGDTIEASRFIEYKSVFNRFVNHLKSIDVVDRESMVVCITGDIIETKGAIGGPGIELFFKLVKDIATLSPVYIIKGNHDYRQENDDKDNTELDIIGPLLGGLQSDDCVNIAYLRDTGHYIAGNVGFSLVAIHDALKCGASSGIVDNLPEFPKPHLFPDHIDTKIALFHGSVPNPYSLDWFGSGFDILVLGDIHKQQVNNAIPKFDRIMMTDVDNDIFIVNEYTSKGCMWGYPGSTVQQNFGESIGGHGFIKWDIIKKTAIAYHIKNDYGIVYVKNKDDTWLANLSFYTGIEMNKTIDNWIDINILANLEWFPKHLDVKIKGSLFSAEEKARASIALKQAGFIVQTLDDALVCNNNISDPAKDRDPFENLTQCNSPDAWLAYINEQVETSNVDLKFDGWNEWLVDPNNIRINQELFPDINVSLSSNIVERNVKIQKLIDSYKTTINDEVDRASFNKSFKITYMNWSNILCYGDDNYFNFKNIDKKVICINGKNGGGKTSFMETICIAIFGDGFPSRKSSNNTDIINHQIKEKQRAFTSIVFILDNDTFRITRTFDTQTKDTGKKVLAMRNIKVEKYNGSSLIFDTIKEGGDATKTWVAHHIGKMDTFLLSCMITQGGDHDFFNKKPLDQKTYIDTQLALDSSTALRAIFNEASNAYKHIARIINDNIQDAYNHNDFAFNQNNMDTLVTRKQNIDKNIKDTKHTIDEIDTVIGTGNIDEFTLNQGKHSIETRIKDLQSTTFQFTDQHESLDEMIQIKGNYIGERLATINMMKGVDMLANVDIHAIKPTVPFDVVVVVLEDARIAKQQFGDQDEFGLNFDIDAIEEKIAQVTSNIGKHNDVVKTSIDVVQSNGDVVKAIEQNITKMNASKPKEPRSNDNERNTWKQFETVVGSIMKIYNGVPVCVPGECKKRIEELVDTHNANIPKHDRPSMTEQELDKQNLRIVKWLQQNNMRSVQNASSTLSKEIAKLGYKKEQLKEKKNTINQEIGVLRVELEQASVNKESTNTKLLQLLGNKPDDPPFAQKIKRNAAFKEFTTMQKQLVTLNDDVPTDIEKENALILIDNYHSMRAKYDSLNDNIKHYEDLVHGCDKHEFNPDCEACKKQPWKIKLDNMTQELEKFKEGRASVINDMKRMFGKIVDLVDLQKAKCTVDKWNVFTKLKEQVDQLSAYWSNVEKVEAAFRTWSDVKTTLDKQTKEANTMHSKKMNEYNDRVAKHAIVEGDIATCESQLEKVVRVENELNEDYNPMHTTICNMKIAIVEWKKWDHENTMLMEDLGKMNSFIEKSEFWEEEFIRHQNGITWMLASSNLDAKYTSAIHNLETSAKRARDEEQGLERLNNVKRELEGQHVVLVQTRDAFVKASKDLEKARSLKRGYDAWNIAEIERLRCLIVNMDMDIETWRARDANAENIKGLQIQLDIFDSCHRKRELNKRLDKYINEKIEVERDLAVMDDAQRRFNLLKASIDTQVALMANVNAIKETLDTVNQLFAGYKLWVLKEKVMPQLVGRVNSLLAVMCRNHRDISIDAVFYNGGVGGQLLAKGDDILFNWFVQDGLNKPPLEKTSGFQRFVIGLAMRITLGNLGVAGLANRQLFIDEGFTACDASNLGNVPTFLNDLTDIYDTVFIVSHLDDIKNAIDVNNCITVLRNENTSSSIIKFGIKSNELTTIKKRGRPAKY